jgi:hypothetical protein
VTGGRRKLHNEELQNLYSSQIIIRRIKSRKMSRICSTHGIEEECVQDFGGEARREDNTRKIKTWVGE